MSNERVVKAAEAVEDLRAALERWSERHPESGDPLYVSNAAAEASSAIHTAIAELTSLRTEVYQQDVDYQNARQSRTDALLSGMRPPASVPGLRTDVGPLPVDDNPDAADYKCGECGQVFVVDLADPIESHGAYLDHLDEHDDAADDERDKASEGAL